MTGLLPTLSEMKLNRSSHIDRIIARSSFPFFPHQSGVFKLLFGPTSHHLHGPRRFSLSGKDSKFYFVLLTLIYMRFLLFIRPLALIFYLLHKSRTSMTFTATLFASTPLSPWSICSRTLFGLKPLHTGIWELFFLCHNQYETISVRFEPMILLVGFF